MEAGLRQAEEMIGRSLPEARRHRDSGLRLVQHFHEHPGEERALASDFPEGSEFNLALRERDAVGLWRPGCSREEAFEELAAAEARLAGLLESERAVAHALSP